MFTTLTLLVQTMRHHLRGNLPVGLGVAVGTAVLTGALLVGDSLRGSLKDRADRQRGHATSAWIGTRFLREGIARELPGTPLPAIVLNGPLESGDGQKRLSRITVMGMPRDRGDWFPGVRFDRPDGVVLSAVVAAKLNATVGEPVRLSVEKPSLIPRGSLLGQRANDDVSQSLRMTVAAILPPDDAANDFALAPSAAAPLNVFVPLDFLQSRIDRPGQCNVILSTHADDQELNRRLNEKLEPEDFGLVFRARRQSPWGRKVAGPDLPYLSVESEQLILDPALVRAVTASVSGHRLEPTTAYLANSLAAMGREIPYSLIVALNPSAAAPLGPFLPAGADAIGDEEIVLLDWPGNPLAGLSPGTPIRLTYFKPEIEAGAEEVAVTLKLKGYRSLEGAAVDPSLSPPFKGITDKTTIRDWKPPFPYDPGKIKPNDVNEKFWDDYRTTPKAYVSRATGDRLFASRFGSVTSLRIAPHANETPAAMLNTVRASVKSNLDAAQAGFQFSNLKSRGADASQGGQDFGGLFLGFSLFLIVSSLLLMGLLFRLNVERRARELGVLRATGWPTPKIRRQLQLEGLLIAAGGSVAGLLIAVLYARGLLSILIRLWPDSSIGSFLTLHVTPVALATGGILGILAALVAIVLALRGLLQVPVPQSLRGSVHRDQDDRPAGRGSLLLIVALVIMAFSQLAYGTTVNEPDLRAGCFFGGGAMLLAAGVLAARRWLRRIPSIPAQSISQLAKRNASRNRGRSLLTLTLIATAVFLLMAVESFRRTPEADFSAKTGGSGGYPLLAESDVPFLLPFDRGEGREQLLDGFRRAVQTDNDAAEQTARAAALLDGMTALPLRIRDGDDASCLNLYRAGRPRILGVPDSLIDGGGFRFAASLAKSDDDKANPWRLLQQPDPDGAIPAIVEQNTLMWMLKKGLGDTIEQTDEAGQPVRFRLVAALLDSPFQSELLISGANFRKLYPRTEGYRAALIRVPDQRETDITRILETGLRSFGVTVSPTRDKVAGYQAVVGAYLTLFQLLGAFGMLLGIVGLAVAILRGIWERSAEFALLRAVGFSPQLVLQLVTIENLRLLVIGVLLGCTAAIAAVLPHQSLGGSVPWLRLLILIAVIGLAGVAAVILATRSVTRLPVIPALRKE